MDRAYKASKDEAADEIKKFIILFDGCRKQQQVSECSKCKRWSKEDEHHFDDCLYGKEHVKMDQPSKEYHPLLDRIGLSPELEQAIFPPKVKREVYSWLEPGMKKRSRFDSVEPILDVNDDP